MPWTDDEKLCACLVRDTELLHKSLSAARLLPRSTFVSSDRCTRESRIGTERVSEKPAVAEKVKFSKKKTCPAVLVLSVTIVRAIPAGTRAAMPEHKAPVVAFGGISRRGRVCRLMEEKDS